MLEDYLVKESSLNHLTFQTNVCLAPYTTFGIGGPADYLVLPKSEEALLSLVDYLRQGEIRFEVFGRGSNILFSDRGFRGVVILTRNLRSFSMTDTVIRAACGASLITLSAAALRASLSGLEFACGIPGSVGGAVFMNAGAHGREMKDIVLSSRYLSEDGKIVEITDHAFSYRHSVYQKTNRIILSCSLGLSYGRPDEIAARMTENKRKREETQPIASKSAGSVFRREENFIPAKAIDEAGLKGLSVGDAAISEKHAGFIVNQGSAKAEDVLTLIEQVRKIIFNLYQRDPIPEIRFIPER